MSTSRQNGLEGPGREAPGGKVELPTYLRSLWEGGHGERGQAPTEQEMWPLPSPTPTLVMNMGPATRGEDPDRADEWIPKGWGKFMNGGHKRRRREVRLILNLDLSKNNPPTSP